MATPEDSRILVNLKQSLAAAGGGFESPMGRYNGGWCKTVERLDKSKDNGYSLVGEFVHKESVQAYQEPGLYLDCDIGGSRRNQVKYYTLFALKADGTVEVLQTLSVRAGRTSDWAVRLWPAIESYFESQRGVEVRRAELAERVERLRREMAEAEAELLSLEGEKAVAQ
jgi:hypothetical protein